MISLILTLIVLGKIKSRKALIEMLEHTSGFYNIESRRTCQDIVRAYDAITAKRADIADVNRRIEFAHAQAYRNKISRMYNNALYTAKKLRGK